MTAPRIDGVLPRARRQRRDGACLFVALFVSACAAAVHAPPAPGTDAAARDAAVPEGDSGPALDDEARALLARHRVELGYSPRAAAGLPLIQASTLALDDDALVALEANGFVIARDRRFRGFVDALKAIYREDLPLFVSADLILDAVHRSFVDILTWLESSHFAPMLGDLLASLRASLPAAPISETARLDLDLHLAVAATLLSGEARAPVAGASPDEAARFVELATRAEDVDFAASVFGSVRTIDFTRLRPRGHYARSEEQGRYFRAMVWLSQIDLRLVEVDDTGERLDRRQLEDAVALRALMSPEDLSAWRRLERSVGAFVGPADAMTVEQVDEWLEALGTRELSRFSDEELVRSLAVGGYGEQRIAGHILFGGTSGTRPLPRALAFFPERYVVDSHVLSNLVYDRVGGGDVQRLMPSPLDVAFTTLGNDHAASLLVDELVAHPYAPDLAAARAMVDARTDADWSATLYDQWLGALRALSPRADRGLDPRLPVVARTEAWQRRVTSTQLASWAELRHDTMLYARQSTSSGFACEYPDVFVDPYPSFWAAIERYAHHGRALAEQLPVESEWSIATVAAQHFEAVASVAAVLRDMAERELRREPFTEEQMAFVNQAVTTGCGGAIVGWYAQLLFDPYGEPRNQPSSTPVADVHTQPTDELGTPVGRILHVGVGLPRAMVVTADTCHGPRAYVGPVFSYHEEITRDFDRLDDDRFLERVLADEPADVPWMSDVVVGERNTEPRPPYDD